MAVEFYRVVGEPEVRSGYLNLTDESGVARGGLFPPHKTKLVIVDGQGRETRAERTGGNQVWGMLFQWFAANDVIAGARIHVKFDPSEMRQDLPVIHLVPVGAAVVTGAPKVENEETTPEIPLDFEQHVEDFLVAHLSQLEPGLALFRDEDGHTGRQYPTDVGTIDLLCSRNSGDLLVVELKRAKGTDATVGQISRYIGWVLEYLAGQKQVNGLILAHDRDEKLEYAVRANDRLALRYYKIRLELLSPGVKPQ